jgi:DnaK suppressor protein
MEDYQSQTANSLDDVQAAEKAQVVGDESDTANLELDAENKMKQTERANNYIKKIEFALQRLAEGTYGYSVISGEEIGLKRMLARPVATMTANEQEEYEKHN